MILSRDPATGRDQNVFYRSGVGAQKAYPGMANRILRWTDRWLGGAWGAGFEVGIEAAAETLVQNYMEGDRVFLFGYSRGAAQLRALTNLIDWLGGLPDKLDALYLPDFVNHYLLGDRVLSVDERRDSFGGRVDSASTEIQIRTRDGKKTLTYYCGKLKPIKVELLAVWDTVMALGSRFLAKVGTSVAARSHYVSNTPARCVRNALQALAVDERRWDFSPEIWSGHLQGQRLEQRWFAGTHSDLGGGHHDDGLANIPFQWFVQEAQCLGLAFSSKVLTIHYFPHTDSELHESMSLPYRLGEVVRFRVGRGARILEGFPSEGNGENKGHPYFIAPPIFIR